MALRTLADVNDDVRFKTGTNSTSLANADLLRIANKVYRQIIRALVELGEDFYAEISSFDLVADQQEYTAPGEASTSPFGGGAIKIQRLEISYDGTNWKVADPLSWQQIDKATKLAADITGQFTRSAPRYTLKDRNLFLFPIPSSSDSVAASNKNGRLFFIKRPAEMTATTDIPEITPDFLGLLSTGMTIDVYEKIGRASDMRDALQLFNIGLLQMKQQEENYGEDGGLRFRGASINYK